MKFKTKWHKRARLQSMALQDWGGFMCDNELGGQGKNHIVFVGFILMVYGLILTLAWSFSVFFWCWQHQYLY